jgi:RHS repeat-associated protein
LIGRNSCRQSEEVVDAGHRNQGGYYPYGEAQTPGNLDQDRFATYYRDGTSVLDYARNRYYSSALGRFMSADPYVNSAGLGDPGSWNRYAYVGGDPVNFNDHDGTYARPLDSACHLDDFGFAVCTPLDDLSLQYLRKTNPGLFTWFMGGGGGGGGGSGIPTLPKGTPANEVKAFDNAFTNALKRLQGDCLKLFGPGAVTNFEGANYSFQKLGVPTVDSNGKVTAVGAATTSGNPATVFINSQGTFLNPVMFVPGKSGLVTLDFGTGLRGADFGALLLLHELGHIQGIFGPDKDDTMLNRSFTDKVLKDCFK